MSTLSHSAKPCGTEIAVSALYDSSLYADEISFEEIEAGTCFPPRTYNVSQAHLDAYLDAVRDGVENGDVERIARHPLFASVVALSFGFVYSAMGRRPPTGFLNSTLDLSLAGPVPVDRDVVMRVSVLDKQIRRERRHVLLEAVVSQPSGEVLASVKIGCVFP